MSLTRMPKVGEVLTFKPEFSGGRLTSGVVLRVARNVVHFRGNDGHESLFIARFTEGGGPETFNTLVSLEADEDACMETILRLGGAL